MLLVGQTEGYLTYKNLIHELQRFIIGRTDLNLVDLLKLHKTRPVKSKSKVRYKTEL